MAKFSIDFKLLYLQPGAAAVRVAAAERGVERADGGVPRGATAAAAHAAAGEGGEGVR